MNRRESADLLALFGVCVVLSVAFYYQFALGELPCALCNLQRVAYMIFGAGLLLNLWSGYHPFNYMLSAAGALVGSLIALLQMFVHVLPGTPPTGTAFLGLHMYSLSYVLFIVALVYAIVALSAAARRPRASGTESLEPYFLPMAVVITLFIFLVAANVVSAWLENGFHPFLAGGQQHYEMLYDGNVMKR